MLNSTQTRTHLITQKNMHCYFRTPPFWLGKAAAHRSNKYYIPYIYKTKHKRECGGVVLFACAI